MTALTVLFSPLSIRSVCLNFSLENFLIERCQQSSRRPSTGICSFVVAQDRTDDRITCQMPSSSLRGGADRLQGDWTISLWNDLLWHQVRVRQRPLQAIQTRGHVGWWSRFKKEADKLDMNEKIVMAKRPCFAKKKKKKAWRAITIALLIKTFLSLFLPGEVLRLSRAYRVKLATTQAFFRTHLDSWSSFLTETNRRERRFWAPGGRTHLKVNYVQSEIT